MKRFIKLISITLALVSITALLPAQNVNDQAPDFTLDAIDGSNFTLSQQNDKVVFMFFFGWNCFHCKANGPNTQSDIYEQYKNNDDFVAIGVETWDGNASGTQGFINITGIKYPVLLYGSSLLTKYKTTYDRIIIVDKQGIIQYKSNDVANKSVTAEASNIINTLLDQTTAINEASDSNSKLTIAPNPVNDRLRFKSTEVNQSALLKVYNAQGKLVLNTTFVTANENSVNVNHLLPGYYNLRLITESNVYTKNFLKVK